MQIQRAQTAPTDSLKAGYINSDFCSFEQREELEDEFFNSLSSHLNIDGDIPCEGLDTFIVKKKIKKKLFCYGCKRDEESY
jgi:hypothetical protein